MRTAWAPRSVRLLILSFYYQPDLSAGSFRTTALVAALREAAPADTQIEVLTTQPNRYGTFSVDAPKDYAAQGLHIHRVALPAHHSDMRGQARAFVHFARAARGYVRGRRYDLVFATSSRLMTAMLGAWIARRSGAQLYLDIRDIFADTIGDLLPSALAAPVRGVFSQLESWTVRSAQRVNLVSPGFETYFRERYGARTFRWYTNGIDEEFLDEACVAPAPPRRNAVPTLLYAGNIGEGQALHSIVPPLAVALQGRARFVVIGDGGRRVALEEALAAAGSDNVTLHHPMSRHDLLAAYRSADIFFLHLGSQPAFEKVLPSKIFEYAALGKPLLAGVGGYAARFIREEVSNSAVFAPGDTQAALAALGGLQIEVRPREEFVAKYRRSTISRAMAADILELARQ